MFTNRASSESKGSKSLTYLSLLILLVHVLLWKEESQWMEIKEQGVDGHSVATRVGLQRAREQSLRKEQPRHPAAGLRPLYQPFLYNIKFIEYSLM